jgi:hypothetical protein
MKSELIPRLCSFFHFFKCVCKLRLLVVNSHKFRENAAYETRTPDITSEYLGHRNCYVVVFSALAVQTVFSC